MTTRHDSLPRFKRAEDLLHHHHNESKVHAEAPTPEFNKKPSRSLEDADYPALTTVRPKGFSPTTAASHAHHHQYELTSRAKVEEWLNDDCQILETCDIVQKSSKIQTKKAKHYTSKLTEKVTIKEKSWIPRKEGSEDFDTGDLGRPILLGDSSDSDTVSDDDLVYLKTQKKLAASRKRKRTTSKKKKCIEIVIPRRNQGLTTIQQELLSCTYDGTVLRKQMTIELKDGNFLRIVKIFQDMITKQVSLRGHKFERVHVPETSFRSDEVAWILDIDLDDARTILTQSVIEVKLDQVLKARTLTFTNQLPSTGYDPDDTSSEVFGGSNKPLICRRKRLNYYKDAKSRVENTKFAGSILFFLERDCIGPQDKVVKDQTLRHAWRGPTVRGGSQKDFSPGEQEFLKQEAKSSAGRSCFSAFRSEGRYSGSGEAMERGPVGKLWNLDSAGLLRDVPSDPQSKNRFGSGREDLDLWSSSGDDSEIVEIPESAFAQQSMTQDSFGRSGAEAIYVDDDDTDLVILDPIQGSERAISSSRLPKSASLFANQRYTHGDGFAGGGGMARAAVMAGLRVKWAFDNDPSACKTFIRNFYESAVYCASADAVAKGEVADNLQVDILHVSPPCQPWSFAHTTPGQNDEINRAALRTVGPLIDIVRPRVVVLEQTAGLPKKHPEAFEKLLSEFADRSFSLRYQTINCSHYGVAQRRPRLFIIAAW